MAKRLVVELSRKQILRAGAGLSARVLRKVFSPIRGCVEHCWLDQLDVRVCIGIGSVILHQALFTHLGPPKFSVPDDWNEGRGKPGTLTLVKEVPGFRPGLVMASRFARSGHGAVPGFAIVLSQD